MATFGTLVEWQRQLRFEYPGVRFDATDHPPGVNAVCEDILVGRFFADRSQPYGVIYAQPRSCGGKPT